MRRTGDGESVPWPLQAFVLDEGCHFLRRRARERPALILPASLPKESHKPPTPRSLQLRGEEREKRGSSAERRDETRRIGRESDSPKLRPR